MTGIVRYLTLIVLAASAIGVAADDPPVALSVNVETLGRGAEGTVVGIVVQVAPEDRDRLGDRARVVTTLTRDGDVIDRRTAVVGIEADGTAMLYKEWPPGDYRL
ncbi:MAG: hypothetical protein PVG53_11455, partial [Holophagae bacterium]